MRRDHPHPSLVTFQRRQQACDLCRRVVGPDPVRPQERERLDPELPPAEPGEPLPLRQHLRPHADAFGSPAVVDATPWPPKLPGNDVWSRERMIVYDRLSWIVMRVES